MESPYLEGHGDLVSRLIMGINGDNGKENGNYYILFRV